MSAIYVAMSLVNLLLLFAYVIFTGFIDNNDVKTLKTKFVLSFVICIMFMILLDLDIIVNKTWTLASFFDCISCTLWAVCTVLNFSTLKRKKASLEIEAFTKLLALYVIPNKEIDDKKENENSSSSHDDLATKENE